MKMFIIALVYLNTDKANVWGSS